MGYEGLLNTAQEQYIDMYHVHVPVHVYVCVHVSLTLSRITLSSYRSVNVKWKTVQCTYSGPIFDQTAFMFQHVIVTEYMHTGCNVRTYRT